MVREPYSVGFVTLQARKKRIKSVHLHRCIGSARLRMPALRLLKCAHQCVSKSHGLDFVDWRLPYPNLADIFCIYSWPCLVQVPFIQSAIHEGGKEHDRSSLSRFDFQAKALEPSEAALSRLVKINEHLRSPKPWMIKFEARSKIRQWESRSCDPDRAYPLPAMS